MEATTKQKLFYFFPVLFCFCLPFGSLLLSAIVVVWTFTSFFNINRQDLKNGFLNRQFLLFYSFFILTLISSLFSSNQTEALFSIEIKLSFLLFPYLLFCFKWPLPILKRCVVAFVSGCFFACLYLIIRAFLYTMSGHPGYFFYTLFSGFIHASYFAMYLILAIAFVFLLYGKWFSAHKSVIYSSYFFIVIFITSVFLCSSKMGLITLCICLPLLILYKWRSILSFKNVAVGIVITLLLLFFATLILPDSFKRLKSLSALSTETVDKNSAESTAVRMLIWEQSAHIISKNLVFGTGVGDANDELYRSYENNGLTGALRHKLNAHNQYLQTAIGMGLVGLALLVMINFGSLIYSIRKKHFLFFIFSVLIIMNFMVESMLQRSDGVLFFAFFYCFFHLVNEENLTDEVAAGLE